MQLLIFCLLLTAVFSKTISAQSQQENQLQSSASTNTSAGVKAEENRLKNIYRFKNFTEGTIVFRNGVSVIKKINYSILRDEIDFIGEKGDTLALGDPLTVSYISMNEARFYYYKEGFVQTIRSNNNITLGFKEKFILHPEHPGLIYGSPGYNVTREDYATMHDSAAGENYFTASGNKYNLEKENEKMMLVPESYFFWGDNFGRFTKTNKAFLFDHYPKHQAAINAFIKDKHINLDKEKDLIKLLDYCDQLQ